MWAPNPNLNARLQSGVDLLLPELAFCPDRWHVFNRGERYSRTESDGGGYRMCLLAVLRLADKVERRPPDVPLSSPWHHSRLKTWATFFGALQGVNPSCSLIFSAIGRYSGQQHKDNQRRERVQAYDPRIELSPSRLRAYRPLHNVGDARFGIILVSVCTPGCVAAHARKRSRMQFPARYF